MRRSAWFLVPLLLTLGCTLNTDYFSEYRGRNLIGNYPFDTTKWVLEPAAPATDFMTWTSIGSYAGKTNVYQLRILNLMPNGDFDPAAFSGSLPASTWTNTGGTVAQWTDGPGTYLAAGTKGIRWTGGFGDTLGVNLVSSIRSVSSTAWRSDQTYRANLDVINLASSGSRFPILLIDPVADSTNLGPTAGTVPVAVSLSQPFLNHLVGSDWSLAFNTTAVSPDGYLANFRVVPDDVPLYIKATLPSLSSGTLTLLPGSKTGMYSFSVDVLDDPAAGANNVFAAKYLSVRVTGMTKNGTKTIVPTAASRPSGGWATWTTLTYQFGFDFVNNDAALGSNPALTIELSPCLQGVGTVDAGSIYLANPVLNYNP